MAVKSVGVDVDIGKLQADSYSKQVQDKQEIDESSNKRSKEAKKKLQEKIQTLRSEFAAPGNDRMAGRGEAMAGRRGELSGEGRQVENLHDKALGNVVSDKKLQGALKERFLKAMDGKGKGAKSKAMEGGRAVAQTFSQPAAPKALNTAKLQNAAHSMLMDQGAPAAKGMRIAMDSKFMQSPKADGEAKQTFLSTAAQKGGKADGKSLISKFGSLMNRTVEARVPQLGQRAMANAGARAANSTRAHESLGQLQDGVDTMASGFDKSTSVSARGELSKIVARTGGDKKVADSLSKLAQDPKFKAESAKSQLAMAKTIGMAGSKQVAVMADSLRANLGSMPMTPEGKERFHLMARDTLKNMATRKGGTTTGKGGVDFGSIAKAAKKSPVPTPPRLERPPSDEDLDPETAAKLRSQARVKNMASLNKYFSDFDRHLSGSTKKMQSIVENPSKHSREDLLGALDGTKEPPPPVVDHGYLSPGERKLLKKAFDKVAKYRDSFPQQQTPRQPRGTQRQPRTQGQQQTGQTQQAQQTPPQGQQARLGQQQGPQGQREGPQAEQTPRGQQTQGNAPQRGAEGQARGPQGQARGAEGQARGPQGQARGAEGQARGPQGQARGAEGQARGPQAQQPQQPGVQGQQGGPQGQQAPGQEMRTGPQPTQAQEQAGQAMAQTQGGAQMGKGPGKAAPGQPGRTDTPSQLDSDPTATLGGGPKNAKGTGQQAGTQQTGTAQRGAMANKATGTQPQQGTEQAGPGRKMTSVGRGPQEPQDAQAKGTQGPQGQQPTPTAGRADATPNTAEAPLSKDELAVLAKVQSRLSGKEVNAEDLESMGQTALAGAVNEANNFAFGEGIDISALSEQDQKTILERSASARKHFSRAMKLKKRAMTMRLKPKSRRKRAQEAAANENRRVGVQSRFQKYEGPGGPRSGTAHTARQPGLGGRAQAPGQRRAAAAGGARAGGGVSRTQSKQLKAAGFTDQQISALAAIFGGGPAEAIEGGMASPEFFTEESQVAAEHGEQQEMKQTRMTSGRDRNAWKASHLNQSRDLGGGRAQVARPTNPLQGEARGVTGKAIIRDAVSEPTEWAQMAWETLPPAVKKGLQNFGFSRESWDGRKNTKMLPNDFFQPLSGLPTWKQKLAGQLFHIQDPDEWQRVKEFLMGGGL